MKSREMNRWLAAALLMFLALVSAAAHAQGKPPRRMALVIGNDAYQNVAKLQKAGNDANAMARELKSAGFDVTLARDLNYRGMVRAVEAFSGKLAGGDQVVVFFAGHGVQVRSGSYLLPVDIEAVNESEIEKTAYGLNDLLEKLADARAAYTLVVVDACRDNPLRSNGRSIGGTRGLAAPEPPKGQVVVYSASRGQQALDSLGAKDANPNGVFTREFISRMRQPGLRIEEVVRQVQDSVEALAQTVKHEQRPAIYNEARGNFYFVPPAAGQVVAVAPATAPAAPSAAVAPPVPLAPAAPAADDGTEALKRAAAGGDAVAMLALGDQAPDRAEADGWYRKAAAAGNAVAQFKLTPLARTRSPAEVAAVSRMLALPVENARQVNIKGFDAVKAFAATDPFFKLAGGGTAPFDYEYFSPDASKMAKSCQRTGDLVSFKQDLLGGAAKAEGSQLLGGLVNLEAFSSARGYPGKVTSRITEVTAVYGQPFPLTPGKRFGMIWQLFRQDGVGKMFGTDDSQSGWFMTCAMTDGRGLPAKQIPEGAPQVLCYTQAAQAKGIWEPIRRLYWNEASGCLVDTQ